MSYNSILQSFQHFGVHLGLKRMEQLLADLGNPHHQVPIIHVAGTNGKGSVCAYLSSILTEAGYKVGRYTSPHLVDWTERICLNEQPISGTVLEEILIQIQNKISPEIEITTQFEVITAAAWVYFAQTKVDIAVMEVGLGGRLDATNVCHNPLVSIITSISMEHWQRLGPTIADITKEKAGILKRNCPAVIGNLPNDAEEVVIAKIQELNCPAVWVKPAAELKVKKDKLRWASYGGIDYPLPLLGEAQLMNSVLAIAALQILKQKGWKISELAIQKGMEKTHWLGRLQWTTWKNNRLLIDGAHNPAAAKVLRQYIDSLDTSVTWVMGMLSTKDHADIFEALLRANDQLYLVPVPDHSTAEPEVLASLAKNICLKLDNCQAFPELFNALDTAFQSNHNSERLVVLCGSLYLLGYFLAQTL